LEQTIEATKIYFDVAPDAYLDAEDRRWYRVTSASAGYAFNVLWKAAPAEVTDGVTVTELGAHMRLFSNRWYVDAGDVLLEDACFLGQLVITWPKILAFTIALLVFGYILLMSWYAGAAGAALPDFRPLARFSAAVMTLLLVVEYMVGRIR
jgi:hypothetical protein